MALCQLACPLWMRPHALRTDLLAPVALVLPAVLSPAALAVALLVVAIAAQAVPVAQLQASQPALQALTAVLA